MKALSKVPYSGIVDKDIDGGEFFFCGGGHRLNLVAPLYVRLQDHGAPAVAFDFSQNPQRGFFILVVIDDH